MGSNIGQIPVNLAAVRSAATTIRRASSESTGERVSIRPAGQRDRDDRPVGRAGFGQGTISTPAAALITIGRGVQAARELYPAHRELQAALRERFAQHRAENERRVEDRIGRRVASRLPDASTRARNFIGDVNEAAKAIQARLGNSESAPRTEGASIQIDGQNFPVERPETNARPERIESVRRIRVNVLA